MGYRSSKQANDASAQRFFGDGVSARHIQHQYNQSLQQQGQSQHSPSDRTDSSGSSSNKNNFPPETSITPPDSVVSPTAPPLSSHQTTQLSRSTPSETMAVTNNSNKNQIPHQQQGQPRATRAAMAVTQMQWAQNQQRHRQYRPAKLSSPSHAPALDAATNKPKQPPRKLDDDDFSVAPSLDVEVRSITKTTFDDIYARGKQVRKVMK